MEQDKTLTRPANLPQHCWETLRMALAFEQEERTVDAIALLDAFRSPPPGLIRRLLGR